jgi:hypothetical protein
VESDGRYVPGHRLELYDLRQDIGETENLAESDPETTESLRRLLHKWMDDLDARPSVQNPHHDPARAFLETREKPEWLQRP